MKKRVIVDVDAGTDDAVALLLLLSWEPDKEYQVVGITCTHGNTTVDNVCRNVLTTLDFINRLDVPVFRGAEGPLLPLSYPNLVFDNFHGENGFGDKIFPPLAKGYQKENAVAALNRLAVENEGVTLICLGPLTNVALVLRTYPEFSKHLKEVYIMGSNVRGVGNFTCSAEFNFFKDPEAAHIVLSSLTCQVTILPWETCLKNGLKLEQRFNEIGSIRTPQIDFLNEVERDLYKNEKKWTPCDALLAASFLEEKMIKESRNLHMTVELHGLFTRGQGVIDHSQKKNANVKVIESVDTEIFKNLILKMAHYKAKN